MEKKKYSAPQAEQIGLIFEDIIVASGMIDSGDTTPGIVLPDVPLKLSPDTESAS